MMFLVRGALSRVILDHQNVERYDGYDGKVA